MTQLRRPLLALVALFTAAITIDRIGVDRGSEAIGSMVYVLAALSVAAPPRPRVSSSQPPLAPRSPRLLDIRGGTGGVRLARRP